MDAPAERQAFLNGDELPTPAHVKSLLLPLGTQGVPAKLTLEGRAASVTYTVTPDSHLKETRCQIVY